MPLESPSPTERTGSRGYRSMSGAIRELLEKLKFELAFIEDGGYVRSVRTPPKSHLSFPGLAHLPELWRSVTFASVQ